MPDPRVLDPDAGEPLWFLDTLMHLKLPGASTGGDLAVFEQLAPAGSATPMHRHDKTDEYFYVLSGTVVFHGPGEARRCETGAFVAVPRGTPHGFRVANGGPARLLVFSAPATFEGFVRAAGRPASHGGLPPDDGPPDAEAIQRLAEVGARHDVILLGPPPPAT